MTTEGPKLTTTRVLVEYTADDGYSASTGFKNKPETPAGAFFDAYEIEHFDRDEMVGCRWRFIPEDKQ